MNTSGITATVVNTNNVTSIKNANPANTSEIFGGGTEAGILEFVTIFLKTLT